MLFFVALLRCEFLDFSVFFGVISSEWLELIVICGLNVLEIGFWWFVLRLKMISRLVLHSIEDL